MKITVLRTVNHVLVYSGSNSEFKNEFRSDKGFELLSDKNGVSVRSLDSVGSTKTVVPFANIAFYVVSE
jgi:hypothetical protein